MSVKCSALTSTAYLLIDDSVTGDFIHLLLKITVSWSVTPYTLADIFPSSGPSPDFSEISVHIRHDNPDEATLHIHGLSVSKHASLLAGFEGKIYLVFRCKLNARMSVLLAVLSKLASVYEI